MEPFQNYLFEAFQRREVALYFSSSKKKASEVFRADARPFRCFNMTLKKDFFPISVFLL